MPENKKTGPYIGAIDEGTSSARFLVKYKEGFNNKNRHSTINYKIKRNY